MSTTLKNSVVRALFHRFSRRGLLLLALCIFGLLTALLFAPYFRSMQQWNAHRATDFEGGSVSLPERWIAGERGHLLSIRRTGMTLLFPYKSTIVIDPFAERWPADKINKISDLWLRSQGASVEGRFEDMRTGKGILFDPSMRCVSPSPSSQRHYVRINCLSLDSVHSFEFFGELDAVSDFAAVSAQASRISSQHPGLILRPGILVRRR